MGLLRGNKALVTGAGRGIGFAIAEGLAKSGCKVVITGRDRERLEAAARRIDGTVFPMVWDVSDLTQARQKIDEASEMLGGLDIVVNNAGIFAQNGEWSKQELLQTTVEQWSTVMRTNASAVFFVMQAAVNHMLEHHIRGNVLNITSVAGEEPVYGAYGASKITATALTRGWGKKFASDGITINGIAPGPVATEMNHWHEGDSLQHAGIPFGRFATAEEIAELALHLLDERSVMICGEVVIIDGAYAIR